MLEVACVVFRARFAGLSASALALRFLGLGEADTVVREERFAGLAFLLGLRLRRGDAGTLFASAVRVRFAGLSAEVSALRLFGAGAVAGLAEERVTRFCGLRLLL